MQKIWAEKALTAAGWASSVAVAIGDDGRIEAVAENAAPAGTRVGVLLPAPANLHSHAFQRAMAGLAENRGPDGRDSFWTWRALMYAFLNHLGPDEIEAITAFAQMEMLEAGYASVAEFHYLHRQPDGAPYADLAELSCRIVVAAGESGIGLTLLPVLYQQGGSDGRGLEGPQRRFGNDAQGFAKLVDGAAKALAGLAADCRLGLAAHSLRATSRDGLAFCAGLRPEAPFHIHIAEQTGEVDEVLAAWGRRPVEWLLQNHDVDARWCLVHATHMTPAETQALAESRAVAGLCPITEANLGDGAFDGAQYAAHGGRYGVGTDSNVSIAFAEELRQLEYALRLRDRGRAIMAHGAASTGRALFDNAVRGGAQALGRDSGAIEVGAFGDLLALDADAVDLAGKRGDAILDSFIFAAGGRLVSDVWSAGRHLVHEGRHVKRAAIEARYRKVMGALLARI